MLQDTKAALRQSLSACDYYMQLRNKVITLIGSNKCIYFEMHVENDCHNSA